MRPNGPNQQTNIHKGLCLDKGYDYNEVRALAKEFGFTAHIVPRGKEAKMIKKQVGYKVRRWVIERSHSWLNRFRRILIRWEIGGKNEQTPSWQCFIWPVV
ncbi:MAG: transposase [Desulfobacteraceae bacterium]|nr:transposase [Desulfobacteraceae bacterium]MBC2718295.1 transposase [Desulfobacteraceae bacterium]